MRCRLIIKLSQSIDFTAFSAYRVQSAPADEQYFYHYYILSFLSYKIMLCKRCKQGVKQAFHTQESAYLSHSWRYSQILPWQMKSTRILMFFPPKKPYFATFCRVMPLSKMYKVLLQCHMTLIFRTYLGKSWQNKANRYTHS